MYALDKGVYFYIKNYKHANKQTCCYLRQGNKLQRKSNKKQTTQTNTTQAERESTRHKTHRKQNTTNSKACNLKELRINERQRKLGRKAERKQGRNDGDAFNMLFSEA